MKPRKKAAVREVEIFVSPEGDDAWSGRRAAANRAGTDGPFQTLRRALRELRALKRGRPAGGPLRITLRGGVHRLRRPLAITPADSGHLPARYWGKRFEAAHPVVIAAYPGERPVLSGGRRITGWKQTELGGRKAWVAALPAVKSGKWFFRQLWVNGRRARTPRVPAEGFFRIEKIPGMKPVDPYNAPQQRFVYRAGDIREWKNLADVEFVCCHFWVETRRRIARIDKRTRTVTLDAPSLRRLTDDHGTAPGEYYVSNVFEALREPGQWYLDRPAGKVYYLPRRGERIDRVEAYAPVLPELLRIEGRPDRPVQALRFRDITLSHCECFTEDGSPHPGGDGQAAASIPGAVRLRHARDVQFEGVTVAHVGGYGIELAEGCSDVEIRHCTAADLGAGGIKIWHGCRRNTVADCEIRDGGHRFHPGVGVLVGKSSGNKVIHNHIHGFDYTGISVGWTWGYAESDAYGNIVEYNHVHDIGRGVLSDMGGIYTLGVSPGTRVRCNVFHDILSRGYGGWGIYTDEGSTDILIENNLVYRTKSGGFHQHYGCNNIVRNNIFAMGRDAQVQRSRLEDHVSFQFRRNIVYFDNDGTAVIGNWDGLNALVDRNLYFNASGKRMKFAGGTFAAWRKRGADAHSLIADPKFADPESGDFSLRKGSPAAKIGFIPFDLSTVGPRKRK
ncbi:MAG TPA: right-handed parallel beta-helix repeat-containing protein [Phycisphaerae bacterium]|nr:right-handed parallel beta-helix repeat-containing protein [Phycisphaerae bacterium]